MPLAETADLLCVEEARQGSTDSGDQDGDGGPAPDPSRRTPWWVMPVACAVLPWWGPLLSLAVFNGMVFAVAAGVGVALTPVAVIMAPVTVLSLACTYVVRHRRGANLNRMWRRLRRGELVLTKRVARS
jgi:hypothetical protein